MRATFSWPLEFVWPFHTTTEPASAGSTPPRRIIDSNKLSDWALSTEIKQLFNLLPFSERFTRRHPLGERDGEVLPLRHDVG